MKCNPQMHRRRSIRLKGYDYSQAGAYFITICTQNRECLFGDIVDGKMRLNNAGNIIADEWLKTTEIRNEIELDEWVVMPNHLHGILVITDSGRGHDHDPLVRLLPGSNPSSPNVSTNCAKPPAQNYGNAIIGNTSSATNRN